MIKTIVLLVLSVSLGYAQEVAYNEGGKIKYKTSRSLPPEEKLLKKEDFKSENGRMLIDSKPFKITNPENENTVIVSVICQQQAFNSIGLDKINEMIMTANDKVRESLPVGFRYVPKEMKMAFNPESREWSVTNLYTSEDFTGVVKKGMLNVDFTPQGKFAAIKRIL